MARTTYSQRASESAERLVSAIFDLGGIGYVALCNGQEVLLRPAPGLITTTTEESNFYEELLVNPTLLKLASQRAYLDCEGLRYIAIGYGKFVQRIMPMKDGHVPPGRLAQGQHRRACGARAVAARAARPRLGSARAVAARLRSLPGTCATRRGRKRSARPRLRL